MTISKIEMRIYMNKEKSEIEIQADFFLFKENKRNEHDEEYPISTLDRIRGIKRKEVSLQDLMAKEFAI